MTKSIHLSGEYRFLSNFYPAIVLCYGNYYSSVEAAYQAAKTLDEGERKKIRNARSAGEAKRLGRQVTLRPNWDNLKIAVMHKLLTRKFAHKHIGEMLMATGQAKLIEGNHWGDTFWGVCKGKGKNNLGKLLMEVRSKLQEKHGYFRPRCCCCRTMQGPLTFFNKGGVVDLFCSDCSNLS